MYFGNIILTFMIRLFCKGFPISTFHWKIISSTSRHGQNSVEKDRIYIQFLKALRNYVDTVFYLSIYVRQSVHLYSIFILIFNVRPD